MRLRSFSKFFKLASSFKSKYAQDQNLSRIKFVLENMQVLTDPVMKKEDVYLDSLFTSLNNKLRECSDYLISLVSLDQSPFIVNVFIPEYQKFFQAMNRFYQSNYAENYKKEVMDQVNKIKSYYPKYIPTGATEKVKGLQKQYMDSFMSKFNELFKTFIMPETKLSSLQEELTKFSQLVNEDETDKAEFFLLLDKIKEAETDKDAYYTLKELKSFLFSNKSFLKDNPELKELVPVDKLRNLETLFPEPTHSVEQVRPTTTMAPEGEAGKAVRMFVERVKDEEYDPVDKARRDSEEAGRRQDILMRGKTPVKERPEPPKVEIPLAAIESMRKRKLKPNAVRDDAFWYVETQDGKIKLLESDYPKEFPKNQDDEPVIGESEYFTFRKNLTDKLYSLAQKILERDPNFKVVSYIDRYNVADPIKFALTKEVVEYNKQLKEWESGEKEDEYRMALEKEDVEKRNILRELRELKELQNFRPEPKQVSHKEDPLKEEPQRTPISKRKSSEWVGVRVGGKEYPISRPWPQMAEDVDHDVFVEILTSYANRMLQGDDRLVSLKYQDKYNDGVDIEVFKKNASNLIDNLLKLAHNLEKKYI
jgi:hypothetical protein